MNWTKTVIVVVALGAAFTIGRWTAAGPTTGPEGGPTAEESTEPSLWTCPMHPEIKLPDPVPCPKCGMDLVPLDESDDPGPRRLAMSPAAKELAKIRTAPAARRFVTMPVRMVGKVDYDETRVRTIASRVAGRLDRLYVDYTGITVAQNDHLVWLYSPELLTAQQELIEAKKRVTATAGETSSFLAESNRRGHAAARDKLLQWGLTTEQIDEIETRGTAEDHMLIRSPMAGVVIQKKVNEGDYVDEGTAIYRIADLSHLWVQLDAYEQDLPWIRYGQSVSITTEALPGEIFEGWISFLSPTVDERTRTIDVRVQIANPDGKLKPGMFVRAVVQSRIADGGRVIEPRLAGKWISPMHPEVVKDGPGQCDVCGMDLVPAENLGYSVADGTTKPLVVPASAVLVTGTRAVVYVEVPYQEKPTFEGREIVLGPRAGDHYIVRSGLDEHERVVVEGAFRVDSAMQIQAKPSMMSMRGDADSYFGADADVFRATATDLFAAYFVLQRALADDDLESSRDATDALRASLGSVVTAGLTRTARTRWDDEARVIHDHTGDSAKTSIESLRAGFEHVSRSVLAIERAFRHAGDTTHFEAFCPMAFDNRGAAWLQQEREILNPYFGDRMLHCGELRSELPGIDIVRRSAAGGPASRPTIEPPHDPEPEPGQESRPTPHEAAPAERRVAFDPLFRDYLRAQTALADDDFAAARSAIDDLARQVAGLRENGFVAGSGQEPWSRIESATAAAAESTDSIDSLRTAFLPLTNALLELHALTGHAGDDPLFVVHCPMAFAGEGGDWLQDHRTVANPYYGAAMLRCGSVTDELTSAGERR